MKICDICQCEFDNKNRFCSQKCRNTYISRVSSEQRKASNAKVVAEKCEKRTLEQVEIEAVRKPTKCENCGLVEKHSYASHRFCSQECAKSFSTSKNRKKINIKVSAKFASKVIQCEFFDFECKNCKRTEKRKISNRYKFCSRSCAISFRYKDCSLITKYRSLTSFKFSLNTFPNEFDFSLIEKYGWYKAKNHGDNLGGVSRDHILSVVDGFKQRINPLLIAHPANCRLLIHSENISKGCKSNFTLHELNEKITSWDVKYGSYYTNHLNSILTDEEIETLFLMS